jgi:hypothetical protein
VIQNAANAEGAQLSQNQKKAVVCINHGLFKLVVLNAGLEIFALEVIHAKTEHGDHQPETN